MEYHADPALSASGAKLLLPPSVPAKFKERRDNPPEPKPHFDFGHLVHALVLGKGSELALVDATDWRTKAARDARDAAHAEGRIPVLGDEYRMAVLMRGAIREHPVAADLFTDGEAEQSLFATDPDTGMKLRARPDWMTTRDGRLWLVDLKTSVTAEPGAFARRAADYKYHLQAAFYVYVARLLGLDDGAAFILVAVEKEPPYLVSVVEFDAEAMIEGARLARNAIDTYARCTELDDWPGYIPGITSISLPYWAIGNSQPTIGELLEGAS
ncbi:hypothetical protein A5646_03310 [Mycobacterium sp. 1245499.0]|nr:hypothetical protein A5646_03310 [Mycobacterium sp. 1245499.0]